MKLFSKSHDGGKDSGVTGYWLIESKSLFSIVLLRFSEGSREAYHSHAFNALTFWLKGSVVEHFENGDPSLEWTPSFKPKLTLRHNCHKIFATKTSWAISFRGPWNNLWKEVKNGEAYYLTHGRKRV